jgi:phosphoribosylformimino-5-aminoimidazole carboxamide ribotide isomerase
LIKIIPVIDLKDGVVVHARQGQRDRYRPIESKLCRSSDIYDVIRAFLSLYDFTDFYIADLNALCNQGNHDGLINEVLKSFPDNRFWLDRGYRQLEQLINQRGNSLPVLGSESYSEDTISEIEASRDNCVLSLDYSLTGELGAKRLFYDQNYWPESVIIMTLARVGGNTGPDLQLLQEFCLKYPDKNFIAAGGIRNRQDLHDLQQIGVKSALVASALHSGAIDGNDIAKLERAAADQRPL